MDFDEDENYVTAPTESVSGSTAVNSLILDYYKKIGKKRNLEQYFSLSTAQSDVKDTSGTFWQKMKSENDSSDSGGKKSDSSQELCRISIRCSLPDPCSSQYHTKPKPVLTGGALLESLGIHVKAMEEESKTKSESVSPPIIIEEVPPDAPQNSDDESLKSYGNNSQKSFDILDSSTNKPLSPSSSITSQRKLEWDSLADVGYANESDRKTSASSLSTLERLALKQQFSNNDSKLDSILEPPTAHSTPVDENESKSKGKKGFGKKSTKIYKKDVDYLQVNVPHGSENIPPQTINVNLTKHISFNVEKDGKVSVDNVQRDVSVSPEKVAESTSKVSMDREMQTSLSKSKDDAKESAQKIPVLISLNTLRRHNRRKRIRIARRKLKSKKKTDKAIPVQEKTADQVSEAESFEYMPGHMYNQNQRTVNVNEQSGTTAGNKSSLESSGLLTTDSSKGSKHSFTKDLEKSIEILRAALQKNGDDTNLRKELIKQVCERLLKSKYRDDESTSDFLSGLSFGSRKLGLGQRNHTSTSTSDNSGEKLTRPKKSILRNDKFNSGAIASTSQSAPNLPIAASSDKLVTSKLLKNLTSNTDSDLSNKDKSSSDNVFAKTSSQELYQKYLDALKREENYKRHLKDKEMFLRQKLVCSDSAIKAPTRVDPKVNTRLKDLIKDLTRNNYDDGSGDASKLEGGPSSSRDYERLVPPRSQRSHSVFTLSSENSDQKKQNLKKHLKCELNASKPGTSKEHYCCCPHHTQKSKVAAVDSSVQVNIKRCNDSACEPKNLSPRERLEGKKESPRCLANVANDSGDIKYVCLCNNKTIQDVPDNFLIFKCSRMAKGNEEASTKSSHSSSQSRNVSPRKNKEAAITDVFTSREQTSSPRNVRDMKTMSQSSQTNFLLKMLQQKAEDSPSTSESQKCAQDTFRKPPIIRNKIYETTRWLQTEISINPRIPEPSLSDIQIVTECADIVSEQCRVVSKASLTDVYTCKKNIDCYSGSSKSSGTSKGVGELFDDDTSAKTKASETKFEQGSDCSEMYTIPIQGTNMTLMVSIGGNEPKKPEDMVGECVGTDRNKTTEQSTSLSEECSKGVQYEPSPLVQTDHNCNAVTNLKEQLINPAVNTCLTIEDPTYNTYPKTSPVNQQKPLRRANTDTDNFDKCSASITHYPKFPNKQQVDATESEIPKKDRNEKETQCSKQNSPKCSCQCDIKDCKGNCYEDKDCLTAEECKKHKPERKPSVSSHCSCGCFGDKEICVRNYNDKKSVATQCSCINDTTKKDERKCNPSTQSSCSCNGDQEKCEKKCDESKKCSPKENPPICSKCSCGCNRDINDCNKNCKDRVKCGDSQCLCGCSGDKNNCKKQCKEGNSKEIGTQKDSSDTTPREKDKKTKDKTDRTTCAPNLKEKDRNSKYKDRSNASTPREYDRVPKDCDAKPKEKNQKRKPKDSSSDSSSNTLQPKDNSKSDCDSDIKKPNDGNTPSTSKEEVEKPSNCESETEKECDPILEMIQNITKKYSKTECDKPKRKKCFKEIMAVLNYLLETDDSTDRTDCITTESSATPVCQKPEKTPKKIEKPSRKTPKPCITESSDFPQSTDIPATSSDSATCKVLNKIKKECDRYHQKRCKGNSGKKCDISSSTSANCEQCRRVHHCSCRNHKCKSHKKCEKHKKAVAYNLILQAAESVSEETVCNKRPLKTVVVEVPKKKDCSNVPFQEMCEKIKRKMTCSPRKACRSKSLPNESEISSMEEFLKSQACCTVREYLERNRPDFIAKCSQRQDCLRIVSDSRANMRAAQRDLLSVRLAQLSDVNNLDENEIRHLAAELGRYMRQKRPAPKFISERAMKKHSENIYRSLPEVVRRKEEAKKEEIKKTNLLMANIFRKNLQKKTLSGSVDISNYSPIIKI